MLYYLFYISIAIVNILNIADRIEKYRLSEDKLNIYYFICYYDSLISYKLGLALYEVITV